MGTVAFADSHVFNQVWFAVNWAALISSGVYFATNAKNKWLRHTTACVVGWLFSAFTFELIAIFEPSLVENIDKPSQEIVWWGMAFMVAITIITFNYGRETHRGDSEDY